jgi:hypothetical protein
MSHLTEINCSTVLEEIKKEKLKQAQRQNDSKYFNVNKTLCSDSFNLSMNVADRPTFLTVHRSLPILLTFLTVYERFKTVFASRLF